MKNITLGMGLSGKVYTGKPYLERGILHTSQANSALVDLLFQVGGHSK